MFYAIRPGAGFEEGLAKGNPCVTGNATNNFQRSGAHGPAAIVIGLICAPAGGKERVVTGRMYGGAIQDCPMQILSKRQVRIGKTGRFGSTGPGRISIKAAGSEESPGGQR